MIILIKATTYKDGGTESYLLSDGMGGFTDNGQLYYLDGRLRSVTKNCWYKGYPEENNGNLIDPKSEFAMELNSALAAAEIK